MPGRDTCLGWPAAVGALALFVCSGAAMGQGAPPPPAVSVIPVASRQVTETGEFLGRVTAIDKVDIVARVAGFIEERNFTEGQKVKTGDLLFRLEQATYKAAVEQQRANLAKAKATAVNTALQLQRGQELVRNQNIPQSTLDQRAADDAAAQAEVMQAQALLDQAQINLGYTEIRSPIDGRIGLAIYTVGNLVSPSSGTLATIVSQDPIYVIFQASERDVLDYSRRIAESADKSPHVVIHVKLPNGTTYPHPGLSNFLDVQVDATTDTVAVRAKLPNPDGVLIPGGIVGVTVERGAPRSALTVPQSTVLLDQAGRYVLVVDSAKKVELRRITTGVDQGRDIVVTSGLKEGELVIVEGIQKVHPGQIVTATVVPGN
ncbi:MAG: rane fusion protein multidrug efflux system [Alphaproteobacteria bacterium]|jgi:membrane fusion protein (multidrug efflux system)|nr:rane fusion protein multidrug efflux system [Alphaproteobacteria bacterium]MEA2969767.1 rane fusion protein multidrug efflux system [Alphaproteobacteria bacterium]